MTAQRFSCVLPICLGLMCLSATALAQTPVRIMPLGDSITGSPGCWRALLWNQLQEAGYTNIDFVGTLPPQGCGVDHDGDNEGHGGYLATNVADQNLLSDWLSATEPDIVMMHFGTNDVWSGRSTDTILDAFTTLVGQMRTHNPAMKVLVAQIIPMDPASSCADCDLRVIDLNGALPGWANDITTAQSPVVIVDQWTGFSATADTYDGVHPNASGDQKIADKWFPALAAFLDDTGGPLSPSAIAQNLTVAQNGTLNITLSGTDPDGQVVSYNIVSQPENGSLSGSGQDYVYTPAVDYSGVDSFQFTVTDSDGLTSSPATITIQVVAEGGTCAVDYQIANDWGDGFQVNVTVTNQSDTTIDGYELAWSLGAGESFSSGWNASFTTSGLQVVATVAAGQWNGTLEANGGTSSFGFIATKSGDSPVIPAEFTLNGVTCGVPASDAGTVEEEFVDVPASDPGIRYVGRLDFTDPTAPKMAFPAVTIETTFEGDAIDMRLAETAPGGATGTAYYDITIDAGLPTKLMTSSEQEVYALARDLGEGTHRVRIAKRTEAQVGTASFLGFRVREGSALSLPAAPLRRLEFVGDSITCGYGNELSTDDPASYSFTSANENALLAYGGIAASALEADYVAVAVSGRGMVRNYGGGSGLTVPEFYDLTAPDATWPTWDSSRYTPDVIVVNLGTNDFSIGLTTDELATMRESYRQTYVEFLTHLRDLHPSATLIAAVGPMMSDSYPEGYEAWTSIRSDVQEVVGTLVSAGDSNVHYLEFEPQTSPYGEDWHPTVATHQRMADQLVAFIRQTLGW